MATLYTALAFYIAGLAFLFTLSEQRKRRKEEKKEILTIIEKELDIIKAWAGTSYNNQNYKVAITGGPLHPFHMVFSLKNSSGIKTVLSQRSITLLSNRLMESLVELNQKLGHFDQFVQRMIFFNGSDMINATKALYYYDRKVDEIRKEVIPEKVSEKMWEFIEGLEKDLKSNKELLPEEIYLIGSMRLNKATHVEGIGDRSDEEKLSFSYDETRRNLEREKDLLDCEKQFKKKWWEEVFYILGIATLLIPIFYLFFHISVIIVKIN